MSSEDEIIGDSDNDEIEVTAKEVFEKLVEVKYKFFREIPFDLYI